MALTGNTVQSTYLDLVQLEKSGAGLPSHAGKEAALYDGSGAQIVGRSAVRHWLDPHPDAAAFDETWEFSTTGDMTQGELETAGWTFSNCTAEVANGILWITSVGGGIAKASLAVNFTGDFDVSCFLVMPSEYNSVAPGAYEIGAFYVALSTGVAHGGNLDTVAGNSRYTPKIDGTWADLSATSGSPQVTNWADVVMRIMRVSGNMEMCGGPPWPMSTVRALTTVEYSGWTNYGNKEDATTFDRLLISTSYQASANGSKVGCAFIRRFA